MRKLILFGSVASFILCLPVVAPANDKARPAVHEEIAQSWDELGRELRGWLGRWREHFTSERSSEERPLISIILRNREKLGLSADQVRNLEQLRNDFQKESIRKDADLRVAEMDLASLTEAATVNMGKVETKVREIERLRADQRIARIRTIEKGKEQLTPEQRKKLQELLADQGLSRIPPKAER